MANAGDGRKPKGAQSHRARGRSVSVLRHDLAPEALVFNRVGRLHDAWKQKGKRGERAGRTSERIVVGASGTTHNSSGAARVCERSFTRCSLRPDNRRLRLLAPGMHTDAHTHTHHRPPSHLGMSVCGKILAPENDKVPQLSMLRLCFGEHINGVLPTAYFHQRELSTIERALTRVRRCLCPGLFPALP